LRASTHLVDLSVTEKITRVCVVREEMGPTRST
jgi:hypothetical protein